jgi:hypothetical protein
MTPLIATIAYTRAGIRKFGDSLRILTNSKKASSFSRADPGGKETCPDRHRVGRRLRDLT